jgi:CRP-like cAMP-binding protein
MRALERRWGLASYALLAQNEKLGENMGLASDALLAQNEKPGENMGLAANALLSRLSHFIRLSERDVRALRELMSAKESFAAHMDIVREGDPPRGAFVLLDGMACRYRMLIDGRRQILDLLLPGDICDARADLIRAADHSVGTMAPTSISPLALGKLAQTRARHPRLDAAFVCSALQYEAIQRERMVALGRRSARGRIAYLLCELIWRQDSAGLSDGRIVSLPLTQAEIADALGLTPVHVNRVLQEFRRERLVASSRLRFALLDIDRLQRIGEVNPDYLRLDGAPTETRRAISRADASQKL